MLPSAHHKDDMTWIAEQLRKLPGELRGPAADAYAKVYQAAHDAEPAEHKKDNAARYAANTRLRVYVKRVRKE